jgi:hypothetical protein
MFLMVVILGGCFGGDVGSSDDYKPVDEFNEVYISVDELNWDEHFGLLAPFDEVTFYFENEHITHEVTTGHPMLTDIFSMIASRQDLIRDTSEGGELEVVITFARPEDEERVEYYERLGVDIDLYDGLKTHFYADALLWTRINWRLLDIDNFSDYVSDERNTIHIDDVDWNDLASSDEIYTETRINISTNAAIKTFLGSQNNLENVLNYFAENQNSLLAPSDIDNWEDFDWENWGLIYIELKRDLENGTYTTVIGFYIDSSIMQELWDIIDRDNLEYSWN